MEFAEYTEFGQCAQIVSKKFVQTVGGDKKVLKKYEKICGETFAFLKKAIVFLKEIVYNTSMAMYVMPGRIWDAVFCRKKFF